MDQQEIYNAGKTLLEKEGIKFKEYYLLNRQGFYNTDDIELAIAFELLYLKYLIDVEDNYRNVINHAYHLKALPKITVYSLSKVCRTLGVAYYHLGEFTSSMESYIESVKLLNKIIEKNHEQQYDLALTYFNISLLYKNKQLVDENNKRLEYLKLAEKIFLEIKSHKGLGIIYSGLSNYYTFIDNYPLALRYQLKSIELKKQTYDEVGLGINYGNLASIYLKYNRLDKVEFYLLKSKEIKLKESNNYSKCILYIQLGNLYHAKEEFEKAIINYKEGLKIAEKHELKYEESLLLSELALSYEYSNNFELAYKTIQKKLALQESLMDISKSKALAELKYKFEFEKQRDEAIIKQKEYELLYMQILRNQMNPHFVYNTLNSIVALIKLEDYNLAIKYLQTFSLLTRKIFEYNTTPFIFVKNEVLFCQEYIKLENLRFNNRIQLKVKLQSTNLNKAKIPPMLIQPIIENAVKHGLFHTMKQRDAIIQITISNEIIAEIDYLKITVKDNGIGTDKSFKEIIESEKLSSLQVLNNRLIAQNKGILEKNLTFKSELNQGTYIEFYIQKNN